MFTVYVLYSKGHNKIYIGYTSSFIERLLSHNKLGTKGYTIKYRPWIVVFTEEYQSKKDAMAREKALKGGQGRKYIWKIVEEKGLLSA